MRGGGGVLALLLALLPAPLRTAGQVTDGCAWTHEASGTVYDLSSLMAPTHYQFAGLVGAHDSLAHEHQLASNHFEDYTYLVNLCQSVNLADAAIPACAGKPEAAVYQVYRDNNAPDCFALGSAKEMAWGLSDPKNPQAGVTLTYSGGEVCMQRVEGEPAAIEAPAQPPPPPPTCDGVESWSGEAACVDSKGLCQVGADAGGAPMAKADCETKSGTFSSTAVYVAPPPPPPYVEPTVEWEEVPRRVTLNFTCDPTQEDDMASVITMAGKVTAAEPQMCDYMLTWPTRLACPTSYHLGYDGEALTHTATHGFRGTTTGGGGGGSAGSAFWWLVALLLGATMLEGYRAHSRAALMKALGKLPGGKLVFGNGRDSGLGMLLGSTGASPRAGKLS